MLSWLKRQIYNVTGWGSPPTEPVVAANRFTSGPEIPASVARFVAETRQGSVSQHKLMGELKQQGITSFDFADFCKRFADGVSYIHRKYGTAPAAIKITAEDVLSPRYNIDEQTIYVPRKFIGENLKHKYIIQSKTAPYELTPKQMAVVYGVEEAFHHYQFTNNKPKYMALLNQQTAPDGSARYDLSPIEAEAKREIQQAMRDFHYLDMPRVQETARVLEPSQPNYAEPAQKIWAETVRQSPQSAGFALGA